MTKKLSFYQKFRLFQFLISKHEIEGKFFTVEDVFMWLVKEKEFSTKSRATAERFVNDIKPLLLHIKKGHQNYYKINNKKIDWLPLYEFLPKKPLDVTEYDKKVEGNFFALLKEYHLYTKYQKIYSKNNKYMQSSEAKAIAVWLAYDMLIEKIHSRLNKFKIGTKEWIGTTNHLKVLHKLGIKNNYLLGYVPIKL